MRSTVIYTSETTFQQYGVITLENGKDTLHFSTQGQGRIVDDADINVKLGSAIFRIDYGHCRFEAAG